MLTELLAFLASLNNVVIKRFFLNLCFNGY